MPKHEGEITNAFRTFGSRLRQELEERGLKNSHFAELTGISYDLMNCYLCGRRYPGYQNLLRMIEYLPGVDATWLVTGQEEAL